MQSCVADRVKINDKHQQWCPALNLELHIRKVQHQMCHIWATEQGSAQLTSKGSSLFINYEQQTGNQWLLLPVNADLTVISSSTIKTSNLNNLGLMVTAKWDIITPCRCLMDLTFPLSSSISKTQSREPRERAIIWPTATVWAWDDLMGRNVTEL